MNAEEIFHRAAEIEDPSGRAAYLDQACRADATLRAEVESLLKAHDKAGSFLEGTPAGVTVESPARTEGPGTRIGRYDLLELLGEGGMGLVYLAQQQEPVKRRVALKIIKPGMDSRQVIARFEAERQALAVLDHPNIAHVFDAGCTETGRPYFVMEHVKGMSITRYCDEHKLDIEQRLRLFEQVCEAVQHAHQKGIIHRDLKPSNILVTMQGDRPMPKIIDFGIAKATTQSLTEATMFTYQGQFLGTPEYMSPEQADLATQDIDTRSDIYSLGVVLYELLAGVLPFESESLSKLGLAEIQRTIREQEPASPSARLTQMGDKAKVIAESRGTQVVPLARRLHRELEWIPLKAMRKDRCRRYKSAADMADDIRNYLNGNPLIAGPETAVYRVQKFVRKHAGSVATVALVAVAVVLGLLLSTLMYFRAESMRVQAERAKEREAIARTQAEKAREKETVARTQAEQAEQATRAKGEELRRTLYVNTIQLADAQYRDKNTARARELLQSCPEDLRSWEWNRLNYLLDQSAMTIMTHEGGAAWAAFSADGRRIVSYGRGRTKVWDTERGAEIEAARPEGFLGAIPTLSADGKWMILVNRDGDMHVCDVITGKERTVLHGHGNPSQTQRAVFSPDGKWIVSFVARGDTVTVWDADSGAELRKLNGPRYTLSIAVNSAGDRIAAGGHRVLPSGHEEGIIKVWNSVNGAELITFPMGLDVWARHVVFSPDGKRIASCGGNRAVIQIWDALSGAEVLTLTGHRGTWLSSVTFSPDGEHIASGGEDQTVRVWNASTGTEEAVFQGHQGPVRSVAFSPDGRRILSGGEDGTVKLWDVERPNAHESVTLRGHTGTVASVAFSPDGKYLASRSHDRTIKLWDVGTGVEVKSLDRQYYLWASNMVFSPDGGRIISSYREQIRVWDIGSGRQVMSFRAHDDYVNTVQMSSDGKYIASSGGPQDRLLKVWDAQSGKQVTTLGARVPEMSAIAFNPVTGQLASTDDAGDGVFKIWDIPSGLELKSFKHGLGACSIAFHPDGERVASGGSIYDKTIKIWDTQSGAQVMTLRGHDSGIHSLAFSPDGKRILSASDDGTVKLWDPATGAEMMTLSAKQSVWSAAFSPDGRTIVITDGNAVTLFESNTASDRYAKREAVAKAMDIVQRWHDEQGSYRAVMSRLLAEQPLDQEVGRLAMQIADSQKWHDSEKLRNEAWATVLSSKEAVGLYREALAKAEKANSWEPNDPAILDVVGAAQYRVGSYEEALRTLAMAGEHLSYEGDRAGPPAQAFTAMARYHLGHAEEAISVLNDLRDSLKDVRFVDDSEAKALLAEAEALIEGKRP